jgi:hypothetical protein
MERVGRISWRSVLRKKEKLKSEARKRRFMKVESAQ